MFWKQFIMIIIKNYTTHVYKAMRLDACDGLNRNKAGQIKPRSWAFDWSFMSMKKFLSH